MNKFYSHENKLLKNHLFEVSQFIESEIKKTNFIDKKILRIIGFLIGIGHDFGKYSSYFQNKLNNKKNNKLSNHSLISAFFSYYIVEKYLKNNNIENISYSIISFDLVLHHHGNLRNLEMDLNIKNHIGNLENVQKQIENIKNNKEQIISELEEIGLFNYIHKEDIKEFFNFNIKSLKNILQDSFDRFVLYWDINEEEYGTYFQFLFLFSSLIDGDKKSALKLLNEKRNKDFSCNIKDDFVDKYKKKKFSRSRKEIDNIRNSIYEKVLNKVSKVDIEKNRIFTLTAPTGTGKTLTGFSAALKLRKQLFDKHNKNFKIIYSLPFTSIIDQNYDVIEDVLLTNLNDEYKKNQSYYLIKHHYLSEINYVCEKEGKDEENEYSIGQSKILISSWESEIVITTFVQLFQTLLGYKNDFLIKFHNINNSIIILDEVQNIPLKYWKLISILLKQLTRQLNVYIILMTATMPLIFDKDDFIELLDCSEDIFKSKVINRVSINSKIHEDNNNKLKSISIKKFKFDTINRTMFILNTIRSSQDMLKKIKSNKKIKIPIIYLSTNITPIERKYRIRRINEMSKKKEIFVIISTQLIEAGVDISVDKVIRDMAPFDSIVQVAGRCNRSCENNEKGKMEIVSFKDEKNKDKTYAEYIYDHHLLNIVKDILLENENFESKDFYDLSNDYFEKIKNYNKYVLLEEYEKIKNSILDLNFSNKEQGETLSRKPISDFKLIENFPDYINIYIEIDNMAEFIWNLYEKFVLKLEEKEYMERYNNNLILKSYVKNYLISIPKKHLNNLCEPIYEDSLYKLSINNINDEKIYNIEKYNANINEESKDIIYNSTKLEDNRSKLFNIYNEYLKELSIDDLSTDGYKRSEISNYEII